MLEKLEEKSRLRRWVARSGDNVEKARRRHVGMTTVRDDARDLVIADIVRFGAWFLCRGHNRPPGTDHTTPLARELGMRWNKARQSGLQLTQLPSVVELVTD